MTLFPSVLLFAAIAAVPGQEPPSAIDWGKAEKEIRRLPPSAFRQLPAVVISELNRRRCTIPQAYGILGPHNVISGHFFSQAQTDLAVLCSQGGESSILVFRGGSADSVSQLEKHPDKIRLLTLGEGKIGYARKITPVDGPGIVGYHHAFGGPKPPPIDHEGIEDTHIEKASVILYYYRGRWLSLTGAD